MNDIDTLTERLIDGTLGDSEAADLETILADSAEARTRHLTLLNLEAALRGLRTDLNLGENVLAHIVASRIERTTAAVMAEIADQPQPRWQRRPARHRVLWVAIASIAALVLVAFWIARPNPVSPEPNLLLKLDSARIASVVGSVEVVTSGEPAAVQEGAFIRSGQTIRTIGEDSAVVLEFPDQTRVELHPESAMRFATAADGTSTPRRLVLERGQLSATVIGCNTVIGSLAADVVSQDGSFSLWSSGPGSARVESREGNVQVVRNEPGEPVSLSPGRAAFVRDEITPIRVESPFRVDTTPRFRFEFNGALDAAFTADGQEVWAVTAKQWLRWRISANWDVALMERQMLSFASKHDGPMAQLSSDRRTLIASRLDRGDDSIVCRDMPGGLERMVLPVQPGEQRTLCVSPDGRWLAVTRPKPKPAVRVWDAFTGVERFAHELENAAYCMCATPDGRMLAIEISDLGRGSNNKVVFLDSQTGERRFALPTQRRQITSLAFTRDGRTMAAGTSGALQIWDVPSRQLLRTLQGFERVVTCVAFQPGGKLLAAGMQDGQVWIWSAQTGQRVQVLECGNRGIRALAFSPDGKSLVVAANSAPLSLWDITPEPAEGTEPDA